MRQLCRVHVADRKVGNDQVESRLRAGQLNRFGATGDMRDPRDAPEVELERFVDEQLVEPAILAENERIVETGDEKNVLHLERHQVFEAFKALFGVQNRRGDAVDTHGEYPSRLEARAGIEPAYKGFADRLLGLRTSLNSVKSSKENRLLSALDSLRERVIQRVSLWIPGPNLLLQFSSRGIRKL